MQYRRLGRAGVRISTIALGSWLTYGRSVAEEAAIQCIHKAYELGINFFDTANAYNGGATEEVVGHSLKDFSRDSFVLATKVYFPMGNGPNDRGLSRKHIMEQCHASLRRLGTDYTLALLALAWVLRKQIVSAAIIGATRSQQVEENAKASEMTLTDDVIHRIDEILVDVVMYDR